MHIKRLILSICVFFLLFGFNGMSQDYTSQIVCVEDFADNERMWDVGNFEDYSAEIANMLYRIAGSSRSSTVFTGLELQPKWLEPFSISMSFKFVTHNSKDLFGLAIYDDQHEDDIVFSINPDGYFKFEAAGERVVKGRLNLDNTVEDQLNLRIEMVNDTLIITINGEPVQELSYVPFTGNKVGMFLKGNCTVAIDEFSFIQEGVRIVNGEDQFNGYECSNIGSSINTEFNEFVSHISHDGQVLYISSDNYPGIDRLWGALNEDVYRLEQNDNGEWIRDRLENLNNEFDNYVVSSSYDDKEIYLSGKYTSKGRFDGPGISKSIKGDDGLWSVPMNQQIKNSSSKGDGISMDVLPLEGVMVLGMDGEGSLGAHDLYVSSFDGKKWTEPVHMGNVINTIYDEFDPELSSDGTLLYFSSTGHPSYGDADIFVSERLDDTWLRWSVPKNLGKLVNSSSKDDHFRLYKDDRVALFSSTREGGFGDSDVYILEPEVRTSPSIEVSMGSEALDVVEDISQETHVIIKGRVYDLRTDVPLDAYVSCWIDGTGTKLAEGTTSAVDGLFSFDVQHGSVLALNAEKEGYQLITHKVDVTMIHSSEDIFVDLGMNMIVQGDVTALNNLSFYFDTDHLYPQSIVELDNILLILQNNPEMRIEIGGHSDSIGTAAYNYALSLKRAQAIAQYFIERGVDARRLLVVGYGEKYPIDTNMFNYGRSKNRRIEFKVL